INDGNAAVDEMLTGILAAHPEHLWRPGAGARVARLDDLSRAQAKPEPGQRTVVLTIRQRRAKPVLLKYLASASRRAGCGKALERSSPTRSPYTFWVRCVERPLVTAADP
ncbi:MAG: hypothetical protein EOQ84_32235, partial [Mesorhizobium sp.]